MENKHELIRVVTRSVAFLIPLLSVCIGMFVLDNAQDTLVGAVLGATSTAGIFYFKKEEE